MSTPPESKQAPLIIVTGHGSFATGLVEAVSLIAGDFPRLQGVNFTASDDENTLKERLSTLINQHERRPLLFFCDLVGGTPFKVCATLAQPSPSARVIGGGNLAALIQIVLSPEELPPEELAQDCLEATRQNVVIFHPEKPQKEAAPSCGL